MNYIKVIDENDKIILINIKKIESFYGIDSTKTRISFKERCYIVKVSVDSFGAAIRRFNEGYKGVMNIN